MFIVDGHLDLAYNALNYGRNLTQPVSAIRAAEGSKPPNGIATVSVPTLQAAGVGLVFSTLFVLPAGNPLRYNAAEQVYRDADEAHRLAMAQLDYYHRLADAHEKVRLVGDLAALNEVVASFEAENGRLLGLVPLMEGADPVREPAELEMWYQRGLRLIGPAWDDTRYAAGAWRGSRHGLTKDGYRLLERMAEFGFILDLTHMSEKAALEALERYEGAVVATHSNARALVPGERHLNDTQIRLLGQRDGVIGVVLYNRFLRTGHGKGDPKEPVTLDHVVAHVDHICQLLGDARHVAIGSDFDGGFGAADIPAELDSVLDLPLLADKLRERGFAEADVTAVMGQNWLNVLDTAWQS